MPFVNNQGSNNQDNSDSQAGLISMWGANDIPNGWLELNGQAIDNSKYPALFNMYGKNLPDFRGYFPRGHGGDSDELLKPQSDATALPKSGFNTNTTGNHSHSYDMRTNWTGGNIGQRGGQIGSEFMGGTTRRNTQTAGNHSHTIIGGDSETRPKNIAVKFIIKAG